MLFFVANLFFAPHNYSRLVFSLSSRRRLTEILLLLLRWLLLNLLFDSGVYLVSDAIEVILGYESQQGISATGCLLLLATGLIPIVCPLVCAVWLQQRRPYKLAHCKVLLDATCGCGGAAGWTTCILVFFVFGERVRMHVYVWVI